MAETISGDIGQTVLVPNLLMERSTRKRKRERRKVEVSVRNSRDGRSL